MKNVNLPIARRRLQVGFTAIELLIVVSLVSIMAALAAPDLRALIADARLRNASMDLFADLQYSRTEAIRQNTGIVITPNTGGLANGWVVTCEEDTVCTNNLRERAAYNGVVIDLTGSLGFGSDGRPASDDVASLLIQPAGGSTQALKQRCLNVGLNGRASLVIDRDTDNENGC